MLNLAVQLVELQHLIVEQLKTTTWLEWLGTITGFACVYLAAKEHLLNWPISIISVLCYAVLFYQYKLYGDAGLQLYFLATAIYGWYYWLKRKHEHQKPVVSLSIKDWIYTLLSIAVLSGLLGWFLDANTDTNVPYADGFCTATSFVAQFLMTRKVMQNWLLWIFVDACYVPLYLYKDLALTAVLYIAFLAIAVMGYIDWRRSYRLALS